MRKPVYRLLSILMVLGMLAAPVSAVTRDLSRFATLPPGPGHPEGMTNDEAGRLYVATFELTEFFGSSVNQNVARRLFPSTNGRVAAVPANFIHVFETNGSLSLSLPMPAQVVPLGMVVARDALGREQLYVNDVVNGNVLQYKLPLAANSLPDITYDICGGFAVLLIPGTPGEFCALNDIVFGPDSRLYMSDNAASDFGQFTGQIWTLTPGVPGNIGSKFFVNSALNPSGFPPFGVNGIGFTPDRTALIMVNMSTDIVYKLTVSATVPVVPPSPLNPLVPGVLSIFAQSPAIDGPDDIVFDNSGLLWITSGQKHSVVAVNAQGQVVEGVGSFAGFGPDGAPKILCQPSSIAFTRGDLFVTNECNNTLVPAGSIDFTQLKLFTISRISVVGAAANPAVVVPPVVEPVAQAEDDTDKKKKETEEQRQQRRRTNTSNRDEYYTEGDVAEVHQDETPPYVLIAMRDGVQRINLLCGNDCPTIHVGDYLTAEGEKQHEQLFDATEVSVEHRR
jgi:sugar lactone lactonase YvrE